MRSAWEQRPEGYLDTTTGLLWLRSEPIGYTYAEAMKLFNTPTKRLPSIEEWEVAEQHGICEVFSDIKDSYFWSSSPHPRAKGSMWYFDGYESCVGGDALYGGLSVCCVCDIRVLEFNRTLNKLIG